MTPYILFFLAALGFGFAAPGRWKWLPLLVPIALYLGALWQEGFDGTALVRFVVALVVTAAGVLLGTLIDRRESPRDRAQYA
jgi:hypothetical protein